MKLHFTKPILMVLITIGLSNYALAQDSIMMISTNTSQTTLKTPKTDRFSTKNFRTWSVGIHGGVLTPYTIFRGESNDFNQPLENWGYGGYIKKQILPAFGIQADFLAGYVEGKKASILNNTPEYAQSRFKSHIDWSAAVTLNYTVASFNVNRINSVFAPYVKAGAGYLSSNVESVNLTPANRGYEQNWFIPVGLGVKIGLAKGINLDLGYDVNFVKANTFDGINSGSYDNFSYGKFGLEFALGKKSSPQLSRYSAIADLREQTAAESAELRNSLMMAQQQSQSIADQYNADKMMYENQKAQMMKDFADDDNDGVANKYDKCPGTDANVVVDGSGCPIKSIAPIIKETKIYVTEADKKVVDEAIRDLEFDLSKSTIREKSFPSLTRVANLLIEKNFSLKLGGHTDNTGSMALNMRLSKERAEAVKAFLVSKGANPSRIEAVGYGPNQPIATNKTEEGRQKNRRVEFTLY